MNEEDKPKKTNRRNTREEDHGDPRVYLAAERTLLAWIRTGLAMMGFGFVVARFGFFLREITGVQNPELPRFYEISLWMGTGLIILGIAVNILAAMQHRHFIHLSYKEEFQQHFHPLFGIIVALVLAVLGIVMTFYLLTM